jgi:HAD superfamily hydrolase (TIGR01509 family)
MRSTTITHVIYDMDGLLLDTEKYYTQATRVICGRYGKVFDWTLKGKMIGKRALDSAAILIKELDMPLTPVEYLEARRIVLDELFPKAEPLPGAVRLTRHLAASGIPQAIATSSDRRNFDLKTQRHADWFGIFHCVIFGDDPEVARGKPAPDIFAAVAQRLGVLPASCLVFEDSPAVVEAARDAGMSVIAVPDPNLDPATCARADQILPELTSFDPAVWGLPPYTLS